MSKEQTADIQEAAHRVLELAEEVESSGHAAIDGTGLESARAALHAWIDGVKGVVINPGLGRVTLLHENGRQSTISSPDLPFTLSTPVGARQND